ncbi:MAG: rhodanese-like domain-containing protein [Pseudomonadota bacterium]|nr:rhodanese-like domain-containing protein [Pseudomonadota bacterium]
MALKHIDVVMQVQDQVENISCYDARLLMNKEDVLFVDVRNKEGFLQGHITGAVHCERGMLEFLVADGSPMQLEVFKGQPYSQYIIYCNGGRQSVLAAYTLQNLGVSGVKNLVGGYQAWQVE